MYALSHYSFPRCQIILCNEKNEKLKLVYFTGEAKKGKKAKEIIKTKCLSYLDRAEKVAEYLMKKEPKKKFAKKLLFRFIQMSTYFV